MDTHKFLTVSRQLLLAAVCVLLGIAQGRSQAATDVQSGTAVQSTPQDEQHKTAYQRRQEANQRLENALDAGQPQQIQQALDAAQLKKTTQTTTIAPMAAAAAFVPLPTGINPAVDISLPNWSYSPNMRKFVDSLPGLGAANKNNLGQYIPVAVPNTSLYPGTDYYEIGLKEYRERMHSDLPAPGTSLRGYYQMNTADPNVGAQHYLGPLILAKRDRPVRLKFTNQLALSNTPAGNLPLPVDTTVMGSGTGAILNPDGTLPMTMPMPMAPYTQNRSDIHLHGGFIPWISDGTPHQWITPAGDPTVQKKGVSFRNVPDMIGAGKSIPAPDPGDGMGTYYYPNQQSARLMFYHDHAYGITRLNVYAGVAAGYLLTDQVEDDLIDGTNISGVFNTIPGGPKPTLPNIGGLYRYGIPLVIQDKSFVNDATTPTDAIFPAGYTPTPKTAAVDPLWYIHLPGSTGGDLWFPHEYLPNENIYDPAGFWYMGRWDYGPWILPPMLVLNEVLPSPSHVPEAFMDTMVVNGTAFPYVELPPTAIRFRILNACNDRMLNLQLYKADPCNLTEVRMIPAAPNAAYPTWPRDGRDGGVPDPCTAGPTMYLIGNECGFLAQVAEVPPQPVDFDYDRTSATFGNVSSTAIYLPPAVRADVIVDLSGYNDGDVLILYNDAPAPMPLFDSRYDCFTDAFDWTEKGGAPPSAPGFGPNNRTIMQIRIKGIATAAYDVNTLTAVLPKAFAVAQDRILVPESAYNAAYDTNYTDAFANVADYTLNVSGTTQSVARVQFELPGFGYTTPPTVKLVGGGVGGGTPGTTGNPGIVATATATLDGVVGITLLTSGSGYTTAPTVTIGLPNVAGGIQATAVAIVSGGVVTTVIVTNPGSGYTLVPAVTFTGGGAGAVQATAQVLITLSSVGAITVTNPGSGYVKAPYVYLVGGRGTGAAAVAMLNGDMVLDGKTLVEGMDMEFGRMNAVLGSIPNPLAPTVGAGPVIGAAFYVDPPTEILADGQTILWRISHIGVDSHSIHFHLFNIQLVNRVDWTNTIKPPDPEELGWKETIRTNPFEDIIVAIKPTHMTLPFAIPNSNRLMDPTGMAMFAPVLPPPGIPAVAQIANVMTNYGWEYVWHCHLLGHEENDMMRPIVFQAGAANTYRIPYAPTNVVATAGNAQATVTFAAPTANGSTITGYTVNVIPATPGAALGTDITASPTSRTRTITGLTNFAAYTFTVVARTAAGTGLISNPSNSVTPTPPPPAAPTNIAATLQAGPQVSLTWRDNATTETGFVLERADNGGAFVQIAAPEPNAGSGLTVPYTDTTVTLGSSYIYRVKAVIVTVAGTISSTYATTGTINVNVPAAPTNVSATARRNGGQARVRLTWIDNANDESNFTVERATNIAFTGSVTSTVAAAAGTGTTVSITQTGLLRGTTYYYRVRANNVLGSSADTNATPFPIVTP